MHNPMSEYLYWIAGFVSGLHGILPLLHSNYYFSGMFLPRDNGKSPLPLTVHLYVSCQTTPSCVMTLGRWR